MSFVTKANGRPVVLRRRVESCPDLLLRSFVVEDPERGYLGLVSLVAGSRGLAGGWQATALGSVVASGKRFRRDAVAAVLAAFPGLAGS